jgi:predicted RNA-binding protein with TRAM domain
MYGNNRGGFNKPRNSFAPVKEGEEFDTVVEAVGEKGDGVCKKNGFVIFVPGVQQGDNVRVKITKVLKKVGFGEVVGKLDKAPKTEMGNTQENTNDYEDSYEEEVPEDSEDFGEDSDYDDDEERN